MVDPKVAWDPKGFLQLHDIALWEASLKRHTEFQEGTHHDRIRVQTRRHRAAEVFQTLDAEQHETTWMRATITFAARSILVDTPEATSVDREIVQEDVLYEIEASFAALYKVLQPIEEDQLSDFVEFNCVHNVWPFWRQHVYDTLKRASLPVMEVPFFAGRTTKQKLSSE